MSHFGVDGVGEPASRGGTVKVNLRGVEIEAVSEVRRRLGLGQLDVAVHLGGGRDRQTLAPSLSTSSACLLITWNTLYTFLHTSFIHQFIFHP